VKYEVHQAEWLERNSLECCCGYEADMLFVCSSVNEFLINDLTFIRTLKLQRKTKDLKIYHMQP
jgi:hypothetical protein